MKRFLFLSFFILLLNSISLQAQTTATKQLLIQLNPQAITSEDQGRAALKEIIGLAHANTSDIFNPSQSPYIAFINYYVVTLTSPDANAEEVLALIRRADNNHLIINAEVNAQIQAQLTPNDPAFTNQWALGNSSVNIGAQQAWEINHSARNVPIALIDSGIDRSNTEEIGNNLSSVYDFISNSETAVDGYTHGTKVYGIIAASGNNQRGIAGLAWDAQIMALRVLDDAGNSSIDRTLLAINHAIQNHAKIINLSWGYKTNRPSAALEQALRRTREAGILVICSAGNTGEDNDLENRNYPSSYNLDNIIAVAATDNHDTLSSFSNYGTHTVHLAAPGNAIYTLSRGGYESVNGTSFAAPFVSGTAALIWGLKPDLNYQQVKQLILDNVDSVATLREKTITGGRLNILKALQAAQGSVASPLQNTSSNGDNNGNRTGNTEGSTQNINPDVDVAQTPPLSVPAANVGPAASSGGCSLEISEYNYQSVFHLMMSVGFFIFIQTLLRKKIVTSQHSFQEFK